MTVSRHGRNVESHHDHVSKSVLEIIMTKTFGEGIYGAYRQDGVLRVTASGHKPTPQTKVTLEHLPFLIFPPRLGLLFETDGITNPMVVPFDIEKAFPNYPPKAKFVSIVDKNGLHAIDIHEKPNSHSPLKIGDPSEASFVVYERIGTMHYLISKADDVVLAIYTKVFGPDSYANCQAYVASHSAAAEVTIDLIPNTLKARIDTRPGDETGPKLIVTVDAFVEVDWKVTLVAAEPQGINPLVKLLKLQVELPAGPVHSHAIAKRTLHYEEALPQEGYTNVTIENGTDTVSAPVEKPVEAAA
jgi:hypothetical protein